MPNDFRARRCRLSAPAAVALMGLFPAAGALAMQEKAVDAASFTVKRQAYSDGETSRYRLNLQITVKAGDGDQVIVAKMVFKQATSGVKPTGEHTLTDTFEAGQVRIAATAEAAAKAAGMDVLDSLPVVTLSTDRAGAVTPSFNGGTEASNAELGGILQQFAASADTFRPPNTVKTGDKWKLAYANANRLLGAAKVEGEAELFGQETLGGKKTLKIMVRGSGSPAADAPKSAFAGSVNFDPETGRIVRLSEQGTGVFAGGKARVELTIEAIGKADSGSDKL